MVAHNETRCKSPLHKRGVYKKKLISTLTLPLIARRSVLLQILLSKTDAHRSVAGDEIRLNLFLFLFL